MIEFKPYRLPLATPYRWSKGTQLHRSGLIVRAVVGGYVGWGEAALPPHVDYDPNALGRQCAALCAGLDASSSEFLDELDLRECPARIRCALSTAVIDARAIGANVTFASWLLGPDMPVPARVPVNDLIGDADPQACAERAKQALSRGQGTVKVKVTTSRALDLQRVAAIRAAAPSLAIRIDPNESWPLAWAAEQLRAMERFDIEYCEEPLPRGTTLADYARLRRSTRIPIALDDSVRALRDVESIARLDAADVLILKAQRVGGADRLLAIVRDAQSRGLRCTVTSSLETALGLHLGLHCAALAAPPLAPAGIGTARYFAADIGEPPPIVDGHMAVPQRPGLGFDATPWWQGAPSRL